jgi:Tfp pilus assembly protein PilN
MFSKETLIYVNDALCSEPANSRWLKHVYKAKEKPGYQFLKHYTSVATAVHGCEYLICEIITPYNEFLEDFQIEDHLISNFPEKNFDLYRTYYISTHDSNAGTHHRLLVVHASEHKGAPLAFQDVSLPIELFAVGTGETYVLEGGSDSIIAITFDNALLVAVFTGGSLSYFIKEPYISDEHVSERIDRLVQFLKNDAFHKNHGPWKCCVFQNMLPDVTLSEVELRRVAPKTVEELVTEGLTQLAGTDYAEQLNIQTDNEKASAIKSRNSLALITGIQAVLIIVAVCFGVLMIFQKSLDSEKAMLKDESVIYLAQMARLDSTQKKAQGLLKKIEVRKTRVQQPIAWSGYLNSLSRMIPKGGKVRTIKTLTKDTGRIMKFQLLVPSWDALTRFEEKVNASDIYRLSEVSRKKKTSKGPVSAQIVLDVK